MFCLSKPSRDSICAFISSQKIERFSYGEVGCSRHGAPKGYTVDHNRVSLGQGADIYERAKNAVRGWKMFDMPWIVLCWPDVPIETGATVAALVSHAGFWSLNACRIAYVLQERRILEKRSEEHTSELQSRLHLVCRLLLEKKNHERDPKPKCDTSAARSRRGGSR